MSDYLHAIHDPGGEHLFDDKPGWIVHTVALSEVQTGDYRPWNRFGNIVRLNWSYFPNGTIPIPSMYADFAQRCAAYVVGSPECNFVIIGNEPGHLNEQPHGQLITPMMYADCFNQCYAAIKEVAPKTQVITAPIAPWDASTKYPGNENGDWIIYFQDMLFLIPHTDGIGLHGYTHGAGIDLITSEKTMDPPFQNRRYEFRAYLDFLKAVPIDKRKFPVYWTECDQTIPWVNANTGWVKAAYAEVNSHNQKPSTQKIHCLAMYRWPNFDRWGFVDKSGVHADFTEAVRRGYKVPETFLPHIETQPIAPQAVVKTLAANVRSGPGLSYKILGEEKLNTPLPVIGRSADNSWWQVKSQHGTGWVSNTVVNAINTQNVPVVTVTVPIPEPMPAPIGDTWQRSYAYIKKWEGGYQAIHNDKGNWTTGIVGQGELKGTKYGVSAASYPHLDIKNITPQQAEAIFFKDYWQKSGASKLSYPACLVVLDTSVLHGVGTAQTWLAEVGPNAYIFVARRLRSYLKADNWEFWDEAWILRVVDLLEHVGKA